MAHQKWPQDSIHMKYPEHGNTETESKLELGIKEEGGVLGRG